MKLYPTYSSGQKAEIYSVCIIIELKIIRWDNEPLRFTECELDIWEYSRILKETITPKNWVLR